MVSPLKFEFVCSGKPLIFSCLLHFHLHFRWHQSLILRTNVVESAASQERQGQKPHFLRDEKMLTYSWRPLDRASKKSSSSTYPTKLHGWVICPVLNLLLALPLSSFRKHIHAVESVAAVRARAEGSHGGDWKNDSDCWSHRRTSWRCAADFVSLVCFVFASFASATFFDGPSTSFSGLNCSDFSFHRREFISR